MTRRLALAALAGALVLAVYAGMVYAAATLVLHADCSAEEYRCLG